MRVQVEGGVGVQSCFQWGLEHMHMREHTVNMMYNSLMLSATSGQCSLSSILLSTPATAAMNNVDFPLLNMLALGGLNNICLSQCGFFSGKMGPGTQAEDLLCGQRPIDIDGVWDSEYDAEYTIEERRDAAWADARKKAVEEWHQKPRKDLKAIENVPLAMQKYVPSRLAQDALIQGPAAGLQQ